MADYLPKTTGNQAAWLTNYSAKLATYGILLGYTPADVAALVKLCTDGHAALELKEAKWSEYLSAISSAQATIDEALAAVRAAVRRQKANPNYTDAIGADLGIIGGARRWTRRRSSRR